MLSNYGNIIIVLGPTCTGKSELSLQLARVFGGEIVNADSMQVYRHFNIGTAKPDKIGMAKTPHHLIDIAEPYEEFNAAIFKKTADSCIDGIFKRGKVPIVVGGTGLYIRVLLYGLFSVPKENGLRDTLAEAYERGPLLFYEGLKKVDPEYALKISFRDKLRVVRAMEVFSSTGVKMSEWAKIHGFREPHYSSLKIGLRRERNELYSRINKRVEDMFVAGWVEEVKSILAMGYDEKEKPFSSIGYKEILHYIKGEITREDMVKDIKKQTRRYAKRQFTWFAREKDINWHTYPEEVDGIVSMVSEFLK
jgi:tRNA dimethylallyltransferase